MNIIIDTITNYKSISILPYIDIDWDENTKERNTRCCISIGWLFWELYIDII